MGTNEPSTSGKPESLMGFISFLAGVIAAGSAAMIGFTSFTAFNPPGWLRISTMAPFPFALIAAGVLGVIALKRASGRGWGMAGLSLAALSLIAFIVMINAGG